MSFIFFATKGQRHQGSQMSLFYSVNFCAFCEQKVSHRKGTECFCRKNSTYLLFARPEAGIKPNHIVAKNFLSAIFAPWCLCGSIFYPSKKIHLKILLIDNYDSFTYNLVHYLEAQDAVVTVWRNDDIDFERLCDFDGCVISPGPGLPKDAGKLMPFVQEVISKKPVLGVCLGFQAIVEYFGGEIYNQRKVKHGIAEKCCVISDSKLFENIPKEFQVGLYHSWAAKKEYFPTDLKITAVSENETVMAFEHKSLPVFGVQFHPESVLTEHGHGMIENFVKTVETVSRKGI